MKSTKSALVIGGGFIGCTIALRLQQRGLNVQLYTGQPQDMPPSLGNAGHIAIEQIDPLASWSSMISIYQKHIFRGGPVDFPLGSLPHWMPFGMRLCWAARPSQFNQSKNILSSLLSKAMPAWKSLLCELGETGLLIQDGHFVVSESNKAALRHQQQAPVPDNAHVRVRATTSDDEKRLTSLLQANICHALYFENTGHITDLPQVRDSIIERFRNSGGTVKEKEIAKISRVGDGATALDEKGNRINTDYIVVAAGAGSKSLMQSMGYKVPLICERGYHIEAPVDNWPEQTPIVVFEERGILFTRFRQCLRVSGLVEFSKPNASPDKRKWDLLQRHSDELGVSFKEKPRRWFGARPTLPDYMPAIGRANAVKNLFYAFGHNHLGLTLAPVTADMITQLVDGDPAPKLPKQIAIERFRF